MMVFDKPAGGTQGLAQGAAVGHAATQLSQRLLLGVPVAVLLMMFHINRWV